MAMSGFELGVLIVVLIFGVSSTAVTCWVMLTAMRRQNEIGRDLLKGVLALAERPQTALAQQMENTDRAGSENDQEHPAMRRIPRHPLAGRA